MRRAALLVLLLWGCTSSTDKERVALKSAHSIVAEWAAVARLADQRRVTHIYAEEMANDAKTELASARQELSRPNDPAARLIDGLASVEPDAARLTAAARALGALEQARENH